MIKIRIDAKPLLASLSELQKKQLPFALAKTATAVARNIQAEQAKALPSVFDRPSLFTQRSIGVKAARKADLTATVFVKDIAAQYLEPFEFGGQHHLPASKRGGTLFNPKAVPLNQYGNLPKNTLKRLSGRKDVFVGSVTFKRSGQTVSGVWKRPQAGWRRINWKQNRKTRYGYNYGRTYGTMGRIGSVDGVKTGLKLLIRFGDALPVQPRMEWRKRAAAVVQRSTGPEFEKAFNEALRTARLK
ncbi:hypothetical protein FBZ83_12364 [Azospirillum brasilense]|uniref:Uncharacterized protein n=1 Tax=Azospirillum brasilense TaxID=192 RepID=A0A560BSQ4_AZOBR|nr:hypothetical protein [Azospirillum brasilense]TWA75637.1 hypothetical protein FBZ83_12364 [Azospirillum brasilense]